MHVAIIANSFQEDYIEHLVNHLADKVDRIDLIGSSKYNCRSLNDKVTVYNLRGEDNLSESFFKKITRTISYYFKLIGYLDRSDASVIHIQWLRFYVLEGVFLPLFVRLLGKKVIYTVHDILPRLQESFINKLKFKFIYKCPNQLIVHTNYIKGRLKNEFNIPETKIHVVVHGVYDRSKNEEVTHQNARDYFGLSQSATVILFFGIIAKYKGFDILLKSLNGLGERDDFQILVAGRVNADYKTELRNLIQKFNQVNVIPEIRFIEDKEVEYCFKASDVTVLPYREASQSGVLFMSYAYGVPVIAPNLGGFPDDIIPSKTGYLFETADPDSLAASLFQFRKEWQNADELKHHFIENFAKTNYSWDKSCEQLMAVYKSK